MGGPLCAYREGSSISGPYCAPIEKVTLWLVYGVPQ